MPGYSCAYRPCPTRSGDGKSLFTFLEEYEKAKHWAEASYRTDILQKQIRAYRLCELHFEEKYFSKGTNIRKRLHPDAIPTIFCNIAKRSLEADYEIEPKKVKIASDIALQAASEDENPICDTHVAQGTPVQPSTGGEQAIFGMDEMAEVLQPASEDENPTCLTHVAQDMPVQPSTGGQEAIFAVDEKAEDPSTSREDPMVVKSPLRSPSVVTQTPSSLSSGTPRKRRLRLKVKNLQKEKRKEMTDLEAEDFIRLCDRLLSNPLAAHGGVFGDQSWP